MQNESTLKRKCGSLNNANILLDQLTVMYLMEDLNLYTIK